MPDFWLDRAPSPSDELPSDCEILVVGGGLAGVACAVELARGGANVVLCEASGRLGGGSIGRDPGLVQVGTSEHPHRLRAALGDEKARAYLAVSRRSSALLSRFVELQPGLARLGLGAEADELADSVASSVELGLPSLLEEGPLGTVRVVEGDGLVDPVELVEAMAIQARAAGARLVTSTRVHAVHPGAKARVGAQELGCEMVVYTAGHATRELDSWFDDKLFPVRLQRIGLAAELPVPGLSAQHGYLTWRRVPGGVLAGGARWATPHMEVGETDAVCSPAVQERLLDMTRKTLGPVGEIVHADARIECFTCDNLPLVGALPGSPRKLVCTGFGEHALSLALGCAEGLAEGVLRGESALPELLSPSRLVL